MIGKHISVCLSFADDDYTTGEIIGEHYWDGVDYFVVRYFVQGTKHTLLVSADDMPLHNPF